MLQQAYRPVAAFQDGHPFLFYSAVTGMILAASFLFLRQIFLPVGLRRTRSGEMPRLPPGPKGLPIVGSLLDFAATVGDPSYTMLKSLPEKYGEMTTFHMGSRTCVFLNSDRVVTEIISKRGTATATRPEMPVANDLLSNKGRSIILPQEEWAAHRKVLQPVTMGGKLPQYDSLQELESTQLLAEYLHKPKQWYLHNGRFSSSVISKIAFGHRLPQASPTLINLMQCGGIFLNSVGATAIDWFPQLARLPVPLQLWRGKWEKQRDWIEKIYHQYWDPVRAAVADGTALPSFVRDSVLSEKSKFSGSENEAMYMTMHMVDAGTGTTRSAINVLAMAAMEHPEALAKARAEVDRVCGTGADARLPVMADMENLRYICAMIKENLRWRPVFPNTPEHTSSVDIEFEGYLFPAGTGFFINQQAINSDCEKPDDYIPERWLDGHEMEIAHGLWQFGGGRRICVGYRLAQRSLFITLARLVQCVDFQPDGPYNPLVMNIDSVKEPFPVRPSIRDQHYAAMIEREAERSGVWEDAKA